MDYAIYAPEITTTTVVDTYDNPAGLTYVSNSSLAFWEGKWWAIMDGTNQGGTVEGSPGQQVWMCTSTDGVSWSAAFQPFRDAAHCNNPVAGSDYEWQPNLVVVGDELWCTWCGTDSYISKLTTPAGKWTNYRFEFTGSAPSISATVSGAATGGRSLRATVAGLSDYYGFFASNPIVLSSGRVVCPVTFESQTLSTQTTATSSFIRQIKFNALLTTTDGTTWTLVPIDTTAFGDFCPWEPFVVENPVGHVYCFSRNLNTLATDQDMLLVAVSTDGAQSFSPARSTKMLVPSTRGFAQRVSNRRWVMLHCDHQQHSNQTPNQSFSQNVRRNGALFLSRRGVDDFVAGPNFSGHDASMNYPQFIAKDGKAYINYTSGVGNTIRRSLRLVTIDPLPDDALAYIHPRSNTVYDPAANSSPALVAGTLPYYEFTGYNQAKSVDTVTPSSGLTYAAWLRWDSEAAIVCDSRTTDGTAGQVFMLTGLALRSINFFHGVTIKPGNPVFMAAVLDNATMTVTLYVSTGGAFTTVTGYYQSVLFSGQPSNGDTLTVNGVTYTFLTTATGGNDVQIGASVTATITNLATKLGTNAMATNAPGSNRLIMARTDIATFTVTSGSAAATVETGIPLTTGQASFGFRATASSSLSPFTGEIYEGRIYDSALSAANLKSLFNGKAAAFGYTVMAGASAPGSPTLILDPTNPNDTEFPQIGTPPGYCEIVSPTQLRLHGEASAAVELPYGATQLVLRYKLGATPVSADKYVIATFGTPDHPLRLHFTGADPTKLYANGNLVATIADPTTWKTLTLIVSTRKITIGTFERTFAGKPRCYLGNAYPESLLSVTKTIDYDVSAMTATPARRNT